MWLSNLGKFRRVLVFDAEKLVFLKVFAKKKKKKSVQLSPQETTHQIFQFHQIVQFHVKEIVHPLRFLSWRDSEFPMHPPAHSLTERNSNLFFIPQGFRISDPSSRQGTKMAIFSWLSKFSEFLIVHPLHFLSGRDSEFLIRRPIA